MSSNVSESPDNICVVCFKNVEIFSIGCCDHMVCYECSTRMRVLCRQNECPICRQELPKVVFTHTIRPFSEIQSCSPLEDKKFKICFQNKNIQDAFYKLLEHSCGVCPDSPSFKTFQNLHDHVKKEHNLYYCDLCVEHLKIFTSERQCYTLKNLDQHKKKGDVDDRSHRGHPLCKFCDIRFMDNDCLYRHLRRDHLYCHFCDADGSDLYYSSYDYLREHFRTDHYLCEEGSCIDEKFTSVFRTDIDLKAHRASAHGRTLGKAAAKQARTLELEFTLKPRPRQLVTSRRRKIIHSDPNFWEGAVGGDIEETQQTRMNIPKLDSSEFPSLPSGSNSAPTLVPQPRGRSGGVTIHAYGSRNTPLAMTDENFPILGVYNDSTTPGTSVRLNINSDRSASGRSGNATPRNVSIHVNHKANGEQKIKIRQEDFPALSSEKKPQSATAAAKWTCITKKKPSTSAPTTSSTAATSITRKSTKLNGVEDFPSLSSKFSANLNIKASEPTKPNFVNIKTYKESKVDGRKEKKASSVTIPVQDSWPETSESIATTSSSLKIKSKKKKSKGSSVEEKSDTAKKKINPKEVETKSETNENNTKKSSNSALCESSSNDTVTVKPLPKVEDWFESLKKKKNLESDNEGSNECKVLSTKVSSQSTNLKLPPGMNQKSGGLRNSNNYNNSASDKNFSKKIEPIGKTPPGFDVLNGNSKSNNFGNPPPGFPNGKITPLNVQNPPPGFSSDFPLSNGLTFTNSSGQSFAISADFDYTPPINFEKRNQDLVSKVNMIISNELNLEEFKVKSILFRQNMISAEDYFEHCMKTMNDKGLQEVFSELLVLLPDIKKQQELYQVYLRNLSNKNIRDTLEVCVTCHQVITGSDVKQHMVQHSMRSNFPVLTTEHEGV